MVSLTFDDGPNATATAAILDALAARGAPATFFVFGERARRHPALIERMVAAGHEVEPHCWASHASHHELSAAELDDDLTRTLAALEELGCPPPRFWRPPNGDIADPTSYRVAAAHSVRLITWTLQSCDWREGRTAEGILQEIDTEAREDAVLRPDSVVLMHDVPEAPRLLTGLLDRMEARSWAAGLLAPDNPALAVRGDYRFGRQDGKLPCGLSA
jgi:peptidoglycan/xylan/chitin deacetylase (PgdA/CDA1 family)